MEAATQPAVEDADPQPPTVLTFAMAEQVFAVDVHRVREVLDPVDIRPLPDAPHDVIGMIDVRGRSIAIVDIATRMGVPQPAPGTGRIIVFAFEHGAETVLMGALADRVLRVSELPEAGLEPLPATLEGWQSEVASGLLRSEDGIALMVRIERLLGGAKLPGPFDFD